MHKLVLICVLLTGISVSHAHNSNLTLYSLDLKGQLSEEQVFDGFGCSGKNVSPQLQWSNAPAGSKSFAVTMYDPDAPTGAGWWHWLVFNIPNTVKKLPAGAGASASSNLPKEVVQSVTSFGVSGFGGACPPVGDKAHRYIFTVYALDVEKLPLDATAPPSMVGYYLNQHALAKASLISYYANVPAKGKHDH